MAAALDGPHLQREARVVVADALEQLEQQRRGDADAAHVGVDGDVHHVPDRVIARADQVADEAAVAARRQADAARLGELEHEHRQRPRRREGAALDGDDLREIGVGQAADVERGGHRRGTASGRRTYSGRRASRSTGRASRASRHTASGADTVQRGGVRRDLGRRFQPVAKSYRPVSHRQPRRVARIGERGEPLRRDGHRGQQPLAVAEGGGVRLAPARVEHGEHGALGAGRGGERLERRDGGHLGAGRLRQRAGGGDPDPQPGEGAGADADADAAHVGEARPERVERPARQRQQLGRRGRGRSPGGGLVAQLDGLAVRGQDGHDRRRRRGVEAEDHGLDDDAPAVAAEMLEAHARGDVDVAEVATAPARATRRRRCDRRPARRPAARAPRRPARRGGRGRGG